MKRWVSLCLALIFSASMAHAEKMGLSKLQLEQVTNTRKLSGGDFRIVDPLTELHRVGGLTFYKDYASLPTGEVTARQLDADYALGSEAATFTAAYSGKTSTWIDDNGIIRLTAAYNLPRSNFGYYDETGFHLYTAPQARTDTAGTNLLVCGAPDSNMAVSGNNWQYSGTTRWSAGFDNSGAGTLSVDTDSKYSRSMKLSVTNPGTFDVNDVRIRNANTFLIANATTYTLSFWIKTSEAKTLKVAVWEGGGDYTSHLPDSAFTTVANTWIRISKSFTTTSGAPDASYVDIKLGHAGTYDVYVEGLQLEASSSASSFIPTTTAALDRQYAATWIDANGVIQADYIDNLARVNGGYYDATGFHAYDSNSKRIKGLMVEAAGQNLFVNGAFDANNSWDTTTYPNSFYILKYSSSNRWTLDVGINSSDAIVSVSSDSLFSRSAQIQITNDGSAATDITFDNIDLLTLTNATVYTLSFYIKTSSAVSIPVIIQEGNDDYTTYNDLSTFTTVANTWIRVSKTFTCGGNVSDARTHFSLGNLGNITINIEGLQVEASPYATSFIPTTTASLSRPAETLSYLTSGNRTAATESIFVRFAPLGGAFATGGNRFLIDNDGTSRRIFYKDSTESTLRAVQSQWATSTTTPQVNTSYVATAWFKNTDNPNKAIYINGTLENIVENTDFTFTADWTYFTPGNRYTATPYELNGLISNVAIYSDAKSATDVSSISSILASP